MRKAYLCNATIATLAWDESANSLSLSPIVAWKWILYLFDTFPNNRKSFNHRNLLTKWISLEYYITWEKCRKLYMRTYKVCWWWPPADELCCLGYLFKNSIVNIALCRNHLNKWLQFSIEDIPFDNERWERIRDSMHNLNKTKETDTPIDRV